MSEDIKKRPFLLVTIVLLGALAGTSAVTWQIASVVFSPKAPVAEKPALKKGRVFLLAGTRGVRLANLEPIVTEDGLFRFGDGCDARRESGFEIIEIGGDDIVLRYHRSRGRGENHGGPRDLHGLRATWSGECPDGAPILSDRAEVENLLREAVGHGASEAHRARRVRDLLGGMTRSALRSFFFLP